MGRSGARLSGGARSSTDPCCLSQEQRGNAALMCRSARGVVHDHQQIRAPHRGASVLWERAQLGAVIRTKKCRNGLTKGRKFSIRGETGRADRSLAWEANPRKGVETTQAFGGLS